MATDSAFAHGLYLQAALIQMKNDPPSRVDGLYWASVNGHEMCFTGPDIRSRKPIALISELHPAFQQHPYIMYLMNGQKQERYFIDSIEQGKTMARFLILKE